MTYLASKNTGRMIIRSKSGAGTLPEIRYNGWDGIPIVLVCRRKRR